MAAEILGTSKDKQAKGKAKAEGRGNGKQGGVADTAAPAVPEAGGAAKANAKAKPDGGSSSPPTADAIARANAQAKVPCRAFHANKTCRHGDKRRHTREPKSEDGRKAVAKAAQKRSASTNSRRSQNDTTVVRACLMFRNQGTRKHGDKRKFSHAADAPMPVAKAAQAACAVEIDIEGSAGATPAESRLCPSSRPRSRGGTGWQVFGASRWDDLPSLSLSYSTCRSRAQ
jgi:hypothetical protein